MLTLLGLAVLGLGGTGVAAKFGLLNYKQDFTVAGQDVHVEFSREHPIKFDVQ